VSTGGAGFALGAAALAKVRSAQLCKLHNLTREHNLNRDLKALSLRPFRRAKLHAQ
jgi:hypothetical protein